MDGGKTTAARNRGRRRNADKPPFQGQESNEMNLSNSSRGFSLVELLVAVLIVAILMAVAIPSYQKHVVKTKRAEATANLMSTAQALERCYSRNSGYISATYDHD